MASRWSRSAFSDRRRPSGPGTARSRCDNGPANLTTGGRVKPRRAALTRNPETSDGRARRGTGTVDGDILEKLVDTVVRTADPERVILFGSAARGELTEDSDIDVLVVKDQCQPLELAGDIHVALPAEVHPVDIIVVWPEDLEIYQDTPWRPISSALSEGRTLYVKGTQTLRAVSSEDTPLPLPDRPAPLPAHRGAPADLRRDARPRPSRHPTPARPTGTSRRPVPPLSPSLYTWSASLLTAASRHHD